MSNSHHNNNNNETSSILPPDDNPILKAYENFVRSTPFVTRRLVQVQAITWILSLWIDLGLVVGNVPQFTVFHYEVYRLILSPFICTSFISLIFCFIGFADYGKRLEYSMGSTAFAILLAVIGLTVNLLHLAICLLMYGIEGGNPKWLFLPCFGVWILIFGLLSIECSQLPASSTRRLFVVEVPIRYYPLALLVLFSLFGGFQSSYVLSIGIGYAYQQGKLDKLKVDPVRIQSWEQTTTLEGYVSQQGWITNDTSSRGDWSDVAAAAGAGTSLFSRLLPQQPPGHPSNAATGPGAGRVIPTGMASSTGSSNDGLPFPTTGGRQLGTASRRLSPLDPRQARLEALERRLGAHNDDAV
jgi:membrane associated rhomboid family serine protease